MKLPSFQFYPGDWRKDPELARATKSERGMLVDCLCLLWECQERGIFATDGTAWSDEEIASAAGGDRAENLELLHGLLRKGVLHRNSGGSIFSSRMVRDEEARKKAVKYGRKGGNPTLNGGVKGWVNPKANPKPTPSVSSSVSVSKTTTPHTPQPGGGVDGFALFWAKYPKKKAKAKASDIWRKLQPDKALTDAILKALAHQTRSEDWRKENGRWIPHPTSWLNGKRWEDESDSVNKSAEETSEARRVRLLGRNLCPNCEGKYEKDDDGIMRCVSCNGTKPTEIKIRLKPTEESRT